MQLWPKGVRQFFPLYIYFILLPPFIALHNCLYYTPPGPILYFPIWYITLPYPLTTTCQLWKNHLCLNIICCTTLTKYFGALSSRSRVIPTVFPMSLSRQRSRFLAVVDHCTPGISEYDQRPGKTTSVYELNSTAVPQVEILITIFRG